MCISQLPKQQLAAKQVFAANPCHFKQYTGAKWCFEQYADQSAKWEHKFQQK